MSHSSGLDFSLQGYTFDLPEERIAQHPAPERSASRLMVLNRSDGTTKSGTFADILAYLPEKALLVANNSRVIPARVWGKRTGGGRVEMLLLTPLPLLRHASEGENSLFPGWKTAEAEVLFRPAKKVRAGEIVSLAENFAVELLEHGPYGRCRAQLAWRGDLQELLMRCGSIPLPPYIKRQKPLPGCEDPGGPGRGKERREWGTDEERYQTVYARKDKAGSVAAPTAGLHFTEDMRAALLNSGREWAEVTLYVGYGTFSPVRSQDIRRHAMHAEFVEVPPETAASIARAKAEKRPVIAVGTTSARSLEGAFAAQNPEYAACSSPCPDLLPFSGWTDIFLYPGKRFHVLNGLITNFHLPQSSLLMMVAALAGRERILSAYRQAVAENYRFFSYGDSMLIL